MTGRVPGEPSLKPICWALYTRSGGRVSECAVVSQLGVGAENKSRGVIDLGAKEKVSCNDSDSLLGGSAVTRKRGGTQGNRKI